MALHVNWTIKNNSSILEFSTRLLPPSEKARATEGKVLDGTLITWPKYIKRPEQSEKDGAQPAFLGPHGYKMAWGGVSQIDFLSYWKDWRIKIIVWLVGYLIGWLVGCLVSYLIGWLIVNWPLDWSLGGSVGLVGWVPNWLHALWLLIDSMIR